MKAEIRRDGTLKITAETELEAYALMKWSDENIKAGMNLPGLLVDCSLEKLTSGGTNESRY